MFSFFKKSKHSVLDLSRLKVDMHSHLVPGIDDGSGSLEDSLILIKGLQDLGYSKLVTTPHIMADLYPNTNDIINKGLNDLQSELTKSRSTIKMHAAAEYYLDDYFD